MRSSENSLIAEKKRSREILRRDVRDEVRIERGVLRPQRPHQYARAVGQHIVMRQRVEVGPMADISSAARPNVNATSAPAPSSTTGCRASRRRARIRAGANGRSRPSR